MSGESAEEFRHEQKFIMPLNLSEGLFSAIGEFCVPDPHAGPDGCYEISSLYYDTPDLRFFYDKEESVSYRRKVRLRSYNKGKKCDALLVEIKEKHKHLVRKKRAFLRDRSMLTRYPRNILIPFDEVLAALDDCPEREELSYIHERLHLVPVAIIRYVRRTLAGKYDQSLRITFDRRLTVGGDSIERWKPHKEIILGTPSSGILEVKSNYGIPSWVQSLALQPGVSQTRCSKYYSGVVALMQTGRLPALTVNKSIDVRESSSRRVG